MPLNDARLESIMFRMHEIKGMKSKLKEEEAKLSYEAERMMKDEGISYYLTQLDEHHDLKLRIKEGTDKKFDKQKMATDLGVAPSATEKKDFLINMTEKGKLSLNAFKSYFYYEPAVKLSMRKVKSKKPKKQK